MEDFDIRKFLTENQMTTTSRLINEETSGIPTAEQFATANHEARMPRGVSYQKEIGELMIEFAQMHVEAALEAASEKAELTEDSAYNVRIDRSTIENAYPLSNIK